MLLVQHANVNVNTRLVSDCCPGDVLVRGEEAGSRVRSSSIYYASLDKLCWQGIDSRFKKLLKLFKKIAVLLVQHANVTSTHAWCLIAVQAMFWSGSEEAGSRVRSSFISLFGQTVLC